MPYQIKNGIVYGSNAVSLTQAQYDALSNTEKNNGTVYYIYDSDAVLDASDVSLGSGTVKDLAGSVAVIETSPTTATHAVGSYLVYNGQLYKVISAISAGATLTPSTNISAVSVGGELTSLNNGLTEINDKLVFNTAPTSADLNTVVPSTNKIMVYQTGDIRKFQNAPSDKGTTGFLVVIRNRTYVLQSWYSNTAYSHRFSYDGGSAWVAWI